jgi:hypothetical protein
MKINNSSFIYILVSLCAIRTSAFFVDCVYINVVKICLEKFSFHSAGYNAVSSFCDKRENLSRDRNIGKRETVHKNFVVILGLIKRCVGRKKIE